MTRPIKDEDRTRVYRQIVDQGSLPAADYVEVSINSFSLPTTPGLPPIYHTSRPLHVA
jgi:hypothetical protein